MNNQNIIRGIYDGNDFCLKFKKTTVYKCYYDGKSEEIILDYCFEERDEDQAEISRYSIRKHVWVTFNKVEKLEKHGIIDYHRNLPDNWSYEKDGDYEAITANYNGEIALMQISFQNNQYIAFFIINPQGVSNYYYRLMFT